MEYEKLANDFALTHGVTMAFSYVEEVYDNKAVIDGSTKWNIMLSSPTHTFSFQFFMGPANEAEPSIYGVLVCVKMDALCSIMYRDYKEMAKDMGMNTKAKTTYNACVKMHENLTKLLSKKGLEELFENDEIS